MTVEEAVKQIKGNCYFASIGEKTKEALDMAIKALEQTEIWNATTKDSQIIAPKGTFRKIWEDEQQPYEDCISRKQAIEKAREGLYLDDVIAELEWLPSVTPQYTDKEIDRAQAVEQAYVDKMVEFAVEETKRPKGKWIYEMKTMNNPYTYQCSVCKGWEKDKTKYCPNCGAEMGVEDEVGHN